MPPQRSAARRRRRLLANLERVWTHLGRQPRSSEVRAPLSRYSENTYLKHFGTWRKALEAFVAWVEGEESEETKASRPEGSPTATPPLATDSNPLKQKKRTSRVANLRLGFRVMRRDNFTCRACGRSPSLYPGLVLNVDHIIAWVARGETVEENLQTLCQACNQGKGELPWTVEPGQMEKCKAKDA